MQGSKKPAATEAIPLSRVGDHLGDLHLQLSRFALERTGEAAQTLGAIMLLRDPTKDETFASRAVIGSIARRPVRSVARDIPKLIRHKLLQNRGRRKWNPNIPKVRRTNTYYVRDEAIENHKPYIRMPLWVCDFFSTWSDRIVFSAVLTRHLMIETLGIEINYGREAYSIEAIAKDTGLSRNSVMAAKERLEWGKFIEVDSSEVERDSHGRVHTFADEIHLNLDLELPIRDHQLPRSKSGTRVKGTETLSRGPNLARTPSKSGTPPGANVAQGGSKSGTRKDLNFISSISKNISRQHSSTAARADCCVSDMEQEACLSKKPKTLPTTTEVEERQRKCLEQLRAMAQAEANGKAS